MTTEDLIRSRLDQKAEAPFGPAWYAAYQDDVKYLLGKLGALDIAIRTVIEDAERSLDVIPITNSDYDYHQGRLEAAREILDSA